MPFRKAAKMEAKILRALNGACGTLKLLRCFEHQGHPCMSFELLGVSLHDILRRKSDKASPFDAAQVRDVGTQLLVAVEYLHGMGIIHTDIKTENILLSSGAEHRWETEPLKIKLVDFGSALYDKDWHPPLVGTMQYRPPEAVLQAGWSYPLDMWGVGCVLCEVAKGSKVGPDDPFPFIHPPTPRIILHPRARDSSAASSTKTPSLICAVQRLLLQPDLRPESIVSKGACGPVAANF